jgi:ATP-dependent Clp protease protease subunit
MKKQMWEFKQAAQADALELYIYGDVEDVAIDWVNWCYVESENSAKFFREELSKHPDTKQINIYINSYGGSVFEGTAIYNQLKRHPAQKTVYIDGFACSVASVIAMAGDKIVMPKNAMLMIHNMWNIVMGNAKELRKAADDLDTISAGNRQAYLQKAGDKLAEDKLIEMLDAETWLTAEQCIEYGLADEYAEKEADLTKSKEMLQKANLSIAQHIEFNKSLAAQLREIAEPVEEPKPEPIPEPIPEPEPEPEPTPQENKTLKFLSALMR